jgi:hypothetical protein
MDITACGSLKLARRPNAQRQSDNQGTKIMNQQILIEAVCILTGGLSLVASLIAISRLRSIHRVTVAFEEAANKELEVLSNEVERLTRQAGEYGRRIGSLENRAQSRTLETDELSVAVNIKPTITERRHRVLSLARRGQDPQTIAQTLGMPHGEVELMINLGRAA